MTTLKTIARIKSDFPEKFGIPRQSGVVPGLKASIVLEAEYRNPDAFRGLEGFSHIWLIWGFSETAGAWSPTVRPPRLGGNARMGVFATRSPYRPNPLGLSSVRLREIELHPAFGPVLHVLGADLMDGTPIYDIKPYLPYADCHAEAQGGFADLPPEKKLAVIIDAKWAAMLPSESRAILEEVLACDPRPSYHDEAGRLYGMAFGPWQIRFNVQANVLTVREIAPARREEGGV